jgi:hypothetical protein
MIDMSTLYAHGEYQIGLSQFNGCTRENRWSKFKSVHLKITKYKCPICECSLAHNTLQERDSNNGKVEINATIDHYRPKDSTLYPFLKYCDQNYILMCSDCNNAYKGNLFPLYGLNSPRATCTNTLSIERPLIVNPISDNLLSLFTLVFRYTPSGKKVLELKPKEDNGYLNQKAKETIKTFSLGDCEINIHESPNVQNCRIDLLSTHYVKFIGFIKALAEQDMTKALMEYKKYKLEDYGFIKFINAKQFIDLT